MFHLYGIQNSPVLISNTNNGPLYSSPTMAVFALAPSHCTFLGFGLPLPLPALLWHPVPRPWPRPWAVGYCCPARCTTPRLVRHPCSHWQAQPKGRNRGSEARAIARETEEKQQIQDPDKTQGLCDEKMRYPYVGYRDDQRKLRGREGDNERQVWRWGEARK